MRPANILRLYRVRLRARWLQELFAVLGIAAGVALLLAAQVSSTSLSSSVTELSRGIAGRASLQLHARGQQGLPQSVLATVRRLPGVHAAAPLLEADANAIGPHGRESVQLIGADPSLPTLGGTLVPRYGMHPFGGFGAVVLAGAVAHAIGVDVFGQEVHLQIAGRTVEAPLYIQSGQRQSQLLRASPVALAPLRFAQRLASMPRRVSRILVQPDAGATVEVERSLQRLSANRWNVEPIDYEQRLFAAAATANNQSTSLFAAVSALIGFLFAWGAMLFTVPERRRLILDVRREGYGLATVIALLGFDVFALATIACALGLALGDELSIHLLHSNPAFLSLAFTLGSQRTVGWQAVLLATGGGMLAALMAVLVPLRHAILGRDPTQTQFARSVDARGNSRGGDLLDSARRLRAAHMPHDSPTALALVGLACLLAATLILLVAPDAAIPGMALLVASLVLMLPGALHLALWCVQASASMLVTTVPHLAAMQLRGARTRAVAIASTGALAVFGAVAIQGAHGDLLSGLNRAAENMNPPGELWVAPAGSYNLLHTAAFMPTSAHALERLPGVRDVGRYRGGLLDYGDRCTLVIAPPASASSSLLAGQLVHGSLSQAVALLKAGNGLVISKPLAAEHDLHVGEWLTLPTPVPTRMRIVALSSNLGWVPGTIVTSASAYARAWGSTAVSAYAVTLARGAEPKQVAGAIRRVLPRDSGLAVQSASEHAALQRALSAQALARLNQIATVILLASMLAMAATIAAMIWQRRPRLAALKLDGVARMRLWRTILLESLLLLGVGCITGAVFGIYGQQLADRALAQTIGFPVVYSIVAPTALASIALVLAAALAILALPGYLAADVPATLALAE
ncbi:MAG TPA: ABC transporter permease [Solirubrobacteraceae bacterium]|jgi:putative ABC transport system permease protein